MNQYPKDTRISISQIPTFLVAANSTRGEVDACNRIRVSQTDRAKTEDHVGS